MLAELVARTPSQLSGPSIDVVEHLVVTEVSITWELSRSPKAKVSLNPETLAKDAKNRLREADTRPCEIRISENGQRIFQGPLVNWQLQGGSLTISAEGIESYLKAMRVDGSTGTLTYSGVDQTQIAKDLIDNWQSLDYGDFGIDTTNVATSGVTRTRTYDHNEDHEIYDRIVRLGELRDGFDWQIDPETREFLVYYPERGTDKTDAPVSLAIVSSDEQFGVNPENLCSQVWAVSSSSEEKPLTSLATDTTRMADIGRIGISISRRNISVQATLDDHAQAALDARANGLIVPGPSIRPTIDARVTDLSVGDTVKYAFDAGLGKIDVNKRVVKLGWSLDGEGSEEMSLEFA